MRTGKYRLLVRRASQLVQVSSSNSELFKRGAKVEGEKGTEMDDVSVIENGSMVVGSDGRIVAIGSDSEIMAGFGSAQFGEVLDLRGAQSVVPGLCDAHTHAVFSGERVDEFDLKLRGATYLQIHERGGGIGSTVRSVRQTSAERLEQLLLSRLKRMQSFGTTTVECKSGYGLRKDAELKMLRVLASARQSLAGSLTLVANFCGAHSWMKSEWKSSAEYAEDVVDNQLPAVVAEELASQIDVFHERGVFDTAATRRILVAGMKQGLLANFHGDELNACESAELAAEIGARAVSHCEHISAKGMAAIASSKTAAVVLPTTAYVLGIDQAPARRMLQAAVIVALGSDFNPNAPHLSLPFAMNLACVALRLTANQSLCAATLNAAYAMGVSKDYGSLCEGKFADFVVVRRKDWRHLIYDFIDPPIAHVYKHGRAVHCQPRGVAKL